METLIFFCCSLPHTREWKTFTIRRSFVHTSFTLKNLKFFNRYGIGIVFFYSSVCTICTECVDKKKFVVIIQKKLKSLNRWQFHFIVLDNYNHCFVLYLYARRQIYIFSGYCISVEIQVYLFAHICKKHSVAYLYKYNFLTSYKRISRYQNEHKSTYLPINELLNFAWNCKRNKIYLVMCHQSQVVYVKYI